MGIHWEGEAARMGEGEEEGQGDDGQVEIEEVCPLGRAHLQEERRCFYENSKASGNRPCNLVRIACEI